MPHLQEAHVTPFYTPHKGARLFLKTGGKMIEIIVMMIKVKNTTLLILGYVNVLLYFNLLCNINTIYFVKHRHRQDNIYNNYILSIVSSRYGDSYRALSSCKQYINATSIHLRGPSLQYYVCIMYVLVHYRSINALFFSSS